MSQTSTGFTEERQPGAKGPMGMDYVPTEEERRVFKECNHESFWYRSVPFSAVSMALTQVLLTRVAGFCGYLAGKMSYMKTCQEKFKRLDNSPLGEALRKRTGLPSNPQGPRTELSDPDAQSFSPMFQSVESNSQSQMPSSARDPGYGYSAESSMQTERAEDYNHPEPPVESYVGDEEPMRKPNILYEDLRSKNRENYEVTLTQKAEALLKTPADREPERSVPQKAVKKNIYGDSWDD
ncbi:OCIA domain-containing protein 1 [Merluccius polli]|uniref:OCIA domain-containing protein 1 n=1 Tax=Merluccius polli TaxID=89951 RepID=A0AA47NRF3_MERPO|nr:OCIA domain-containing protein 1 [Merluccius polli]